MLSFSFGKGYTLKHGEFQNESQEVHPDELDNCQREPCSPVEPKTTTSGYDTDKVNTETVEQILNDQICINYMLKYSVMLLEHSTET